MKTLEITETFGTLYVPKCALVIYQSQNEDEETYVEHFDIDPQGNPINAHPLTLREAADLAKALDIKQERNTFLMPQNMLSTQVIYIDPSANGKVIWYTKGGLRDMLFSKSLEIPNGKAYVPSLLWIADRDNLRLYALSSNRRPTMKTTLYHAPFFNINESGHVCMGTVDVNISKSVSLEDFMSAWEAYFFNSNFSHLLEKHNPIKGNCVNLWKNAIATGDAFPVEVLKPHYLTLKNLIR